MCIRDRLAAARSRAAGTVEPPQEIDRHEVISSLLGAPMERFAREARIRFAILIDPAGRILAQCGFPGGIDLAGFASLSAGVHAASGRMARMLGQERFDQLYQGQGDAQIFMGPVRTPIADLILIAVFGSDATVGMVRVLFRDFTSAVDRIDEWPGREASAGPEALERELATGLRRALRSVERWRSTFLRRSE